MIKDREKGFAHLGIIVLTIIVIAAIILSGWWVWQKDQDKEDESKQSSSNSQTENKAQTSTENEVKPEPDPYEGWQTYTNATYGIRLRYPGNWRITESKFDNPDSSATKQEYSIVLELVEEFKYNETINIEVHNQNLEENVKWYDDYFSGYKPIKTTNELKGKRSVQYISSDNQDSGIRLYLFGVEDKTYEFSSLGSSQLDPDYWPKFDKVFSSLQIE